MEGDLSNQAPNKEGQPDGGGAAQPIAESDTRDRCKGVFEVAPADDSERDIGFSLRQGYKGTIPQEQAILRDEIDKTLVILRVLFPQSTERFKDYFRQLLGLARFGLVCNSAQPETAMKALTILKDQITAQEGARIKNQYMRDLGFRALLLGVAPLVAVLIIKLNYASLFGDTFVNFVFLWCGCMAGVWLSFGARKKILRFDDLHILEEDRMEPYIRLVFGGLFTIFIGLLFSTGIAVVSFGAVKSTQFSNDPQIALLLGMACGFSEQVLPAKLASNASEMLRF